MGLFSRTRLRACLTAFAFSAGLSVLPQQAGAVPLLTCPTTSDWSFRNDGGFVLVSVQPGDVITIAVEDFVGNFELVSNGTSIFPSQPYVFTATLTENVELSQIAGGALISCARAATGSVTGSGALLSGNSQTSATQTGVSRNTQGRLGGGFGNTVTANSVFLSTQNLPGNLGDGTRPDGNLWASLEWRGYDGSVTGRSGDFVGGIDWLLNDRLVLGALVAFGYMDIATSTTAAVIRSPSVGGYFGTRLGDELFADGFVSLARPTYATQGTSFVASRVSAAFSVTGNWQQGNLLLSPYVKAKGFREWQPAFTGTGGAVAANQVNSFNVSLGAKVSPLQPMGVGGFLPYLSVALDYGYANTSASGVDVFFSPRFGAGFGMKIGAGDLSVDIDAGRVRSDTSDLGIRLTYEMGF